MTLQQLRYFVATVECGFNISRASESMATSQPAISRQIKLLEQELGTMLLVRTASRIAGLTDSGDKVFETARRVLRDIDGLSRMGAEFMQLQSGRLTIASLHTFAYALLPRAIAKLRQSYPGVRVEVRKGTPAEIMELVRAGEIDLGLSMRTDGIADVGVVTLAFLDTPRVLLVPKGHPLLALPEVSLPELARYPFVAQTELSAGGWAVSSTLKSRGINLDIAVMATDASLIKAHVEEGIGVAIMSSLLYDPERDVGLEAIDVSHIFEPSRVVLHVDPYRYLPGYVFEAIRCIAPDWTRKAVLEEIQEFLKDEGRGHHRA